MWCSCSFICYHIWLFRKHHVFITMIQILAPVLIIVLLTINSHQLYIKAPVVQSSQPLTEQQLYDSVINPDCNANTQIITFYAAPSDQGQAKIIIDKMKMTYFSSKRNLKFLQVTDKLEMIKVSVIHHALELAGCYIGGIVFQNIPEIQKRRLLPSANERHLKNRPNADADADAETPAVSDNATDSSSNNYSNNISEINNVNNIMSSGRGINISSGGDDGESNLNGAGSDIENGNNNNTRKRRRRRRRRTSESKTSEENLSKNANNFPSGNYTTGSSGRGGRGEFQVTIRMASFIPQEVESGMTHSLYYDYDYPRDYTAFLGIQLAVSKVFMEMLDDALQPSSPTVPPAPAPLAQTQFSIQSFPFPSLYRYSPKSEDIQPLYSIVTITLVLGQTFMVFSLIRGPAFDKETGFRTYLKLMGLPRVAYWISWFLNELIIRLIVITLEIAMLFTNLSPDRISLIQRGDFSVWIVFLLLYNMASISFLVFIASFCKRGIVGIYISATIWLLSYYFGDLFLSINFFYLEYRAGKYFMCLNPNSALILACRIMTKELGGMKWESVMMKQDENELFLLEIMGILAFDIFLYFFLTLNGDALVPGAYSVKIWQHFGLSLRVRSLDFWRRQKLGCKRLLEKEASASALSEPVGVNDILFSNVTVSYGDQKMSVLKNCNLQILEKTSTAIIAPSGSGKTTIARLICGAFPPNAGQVTVGGFDTMINRTHTRKLLSLCPAENLVCSYITTLEHLKLIGRLRGQRRARIHRKVKEILKGLALHDCAHRFPDDLVNIQKRKLCLAMSLIGKSDIIVMDCPTRGFDRDQVTPISRFIKEYCGHKTRIFLTPTLGNAYTFADRIAILTNGRILGSGTKEQLESCLKIGYHLQLVLTSTASADAVVSSLQRHMPGSEVLDKESLRIQNTLEMSEIDIVQSIELDKLSSLATYGSFTSGYGTGAGVSGGSSAKNSLGTEIGTSSNSDPRRVAHVPSPIAFDDEYFDAPSKQFSASAGSGDNKVDYPNFDELFRDPRKPTNSITLFLPTASLSEFHNFFLVLEAQVQNPKSNYIECFHLVPYTMQLAYNEIENYMKLNEAKESFGIQGSNEITEVNFQMLHLHLIERLKFKGCQRFKSQIYQRIAFMRSIWMFSTLRFIVPLILVTLAVGATQLDFTTKLEGRLVKNSLRGFVNPVALIQHPWTSVPYIGQTLVPYYKEQVEPAAKVRILESTETFESIINSFGNNVEEKLSATYVVGMDIASTTSVTAMFSPIAFHAAPTSLSLLVNAVIQSKYPGFSAQIWSQPIQPFRLEILNFYFEKTTKSFDLDPAQSLAIITSFGFFLFTSSFILQPLTENVLMLKRLQLNTGLSATSYWLSFFVINMIWTSVLAGAILGILVWVPPHVAFTNWHFMVYCYFYMIVAGASCTIQSYALSFVFMQPKTSYFAMLSYNQVAGLFLYIFNSFFGGLEGTIITFLSRLLQPFNVPMGFFHLFTTAIHNSRCKLMDPAVRDAICRANWDPEYDFGVIGDRVDKTCCVRYSKWDSVDDTIWGYLRVRRQTNNGEYFDDFTIDVIFLLLHCLVGVLYIQGLEMGKHRKCVPKYLEPTRPPVDLVSDATKAMELTTVESGSKININKLANDLIVASDSNMNIAEQKLKINKREFTVRNVSQKYFMESSKVLDNISFVAHPGDLIGIVGPSKSGKTVLLEILGRFQKPTRGSVFFSDAGSKEPTRDFNYLKYVGYRCSQNIFKKNPNMKGVTFLKLFARLRGIPEEYVGQHVEKWSKLLGLESQTNVQCEYFTEATRSRFALAMAFIGDPPLLLLDEPLQNLDPFTKRQFWTITEYLRTNFGHIIIMATSSVADVEPHCSKLGILVNGEMEHFTSPSALKSKLGGGFILHINFKEGTTFLDWADVKDRIAIDFPSSVLQNEESNSLEYKITVNSSGAGTGASADLLPLLVTSSFTGPGKVPERRRVSLPGPGPAPAPKWSSIFSLAQGLALDYNAIILDYFVSEETLEHIYNVFARKQRPYNKPVPTREEFCMRYC